MSLDTYLPVGRGRYLIGSEPQSPGSLFYFMPERRDHLWIGFKVVRQDHYGEAGYSDVVVRSQGINNEKIEEGEYTIHAPGRGIRILELRSGDAVKKYMALGQPGLGRFRFISYD